MGSNLSLSIWGYLYRPLLETPVLLLLLVLKSAFESLLTRISRLMGNTSTTYKQMKLLTAITAAALTFAPISAFAVNIKPLHFAPDSYCGNVASSNTWYTVKARKGQIVRIGFDTELEYYQLKVVNTTLGTTVKLKDGAFIITYTCFPL